MLWASFALNSIENAMFSRKAFPDGLKFSCCPNLSTKFAEIRGARDKGPPISISTKGSKSSGSEESSLYNVMDLMHLSPVEVK